jgi:hypothetical protein
MRSWFARLEHMWMWALMIMLLHTFVYFGSWWHSGIWSGPDWFYMSSHMRPVPRLTCNLYCISGSADVCFSHYSYDLIYNGLLIIFLSPLWFMFVGKNGSFLESPKPRKTMQNKLEASNLFLQGMWCDMVSVTKLLYAMIFIVNINNRQEPYGCLFPFMACVLNIYPCDIL